MKMEISQSQIFVLAENFASIIHGQVVEMHLRRSWGIWESATEECPYQQRDYQREQIQDIRKTIRSIKDYYERLSFIASVKFIFNKIRAEKGTTPKWQDYIASCKQAKAAHDERIAATAAREDTRPTSPFSNPLQIENGTWQKPISGDENKTNGLTTNGAPVASRIAGI